MNDSAYPEHAGTRYMCVSINVIEALQQAFFAGRDLGRVIPSIDADMAAVIVAESLEADRAWNLPPQQVIEELKKGTTGDFKRAVAAEIAFSVQQFALERGNKESADDWWALGMSFLEEILDSPTASPLLWYEDIFWEVAEALRGRDPEHTRKAIGWLKRGLAHNLHYNEGNNAPNLLRDLAEFHLEAGDLDAGLGLLARLVRHDPADVWNYNLMAISFDRFGLVELGIEGARRGLQLLQARGDPEELRQQLEDSLEELEECQERGREAEVAPEVLADLRAALALDFEAGPSRSLEALCRELAPELDELPLKRPLRPADVPLPDRDSPRFRPPPPRPPADKPGRNDPCWCGSGKKYKRCHLREDEEQERRYRRWLLGQE